MNEQEVWTSEPVAVSAWHWFKLGSPTDSYVRPFYRTKGAVLHPFESRSAPIPSAEDLAAMREVCEALRVLRTTVNECGKWYTSEITGKESAWHVDVNEEERLNAASDALDAALTRLAAARAKGGV